jgi:hypothetical protein
MCQLLWPPDQVRWTQDALGRVAQRDLDWFDRDPSHGLVLLPGVLLALGSLVGALLADKPDTAARLLASTVLRSDESPVHWPTRINELVAFGGLMQMNLMPERQTGQTGAGIIILATLGRARHIQGLVISQESFDAAYEVAEYAVGLVAQAYVEKGRFHQWHVPSGTVLRRWSIWGGGDERSIEPPDMDFRNSKSKNALLDNGFVGGYTSAYDMLEKQHRETLAKYERSSG